MKFLIASDIHGSALWCRRLMDALDVEQPDRLLLLGDTLYHGPRNDLPDSYAPKEVIAMLNPLAHNIVAVRGNCEAEVDQMVLDFPCRADYALVLDTDASLTPDGHPVGHASSQNTDTSASRSDSSIRELFLTHGHVFGAGFHNSVDNLPQLPPGSMLLYGHTHKKVSEPVPSNPSIWAFNPGSVSIPKDGTHSYGMYENGAVTFVEIASA